MNNVTKFLRLPSLVLTIAVVGTAVALLATTAAFGAGASSTPAGGSIRVFDTSPGNGTGGKVLITGAIGDQGKSNMVNRAGKRSANGPFVKLTMTKGSFELNIAKINAAANHAFSSASFNAATCSVSVVFSGPAAVLNGTGLYHGITGRVRLAVSVGLVFPRFTSGAHKGKCNGSNSAQPTGSTQLVEGTGTVRFG